ncbi:hypothetical protein [Amycolatopsis saalfeldensis]|uniref:hypothetical protein n=1 Tax=Amycolatopsis saalfeldensis TaxID=394193 RepID=UPI000B84CD7C|nr:hypothetical protein [Amycolatopsis saalfeldensis]
MKTGVRVEATYDQYSSHKTVGWYLTWCDGPTIETMRRRATASSRGLAEVDTAQLRFRRESTDAAEVAAFLAFVLPHPAMLKEPPLDALMSHSTTDFPGKIDQSVWDMARFALTRPELADTYDKGRKAIDYIVKVGLNGLRLDMWLTGASRQADCQPAPPAVETDAVSGKVRRDLERMIDTVQAELVGGSTHRDDPRVQLLVAETSRRLLLEIVDQHQRRTAAHALVDGAGLSSLSTMIGLAPRTLGMRWGKDLDADLAPLAWLRDNAAAWASACAAAGSVLRGSRGFYPDQETRQDLWTLSDADATRGWRTLVQTPEAARRVLAVTRNRQPTGTEEALRSLGAQLQAHDQAAPPDRRERALRRTPSIPDAPPAEPSGPARALNDGWG